MSAVDDRLTVGDLLRQHVDEELLAHLGGWEWFERGLKVEILDRGHSKYQLYVLTIIAAPNSETMQMTLRDSEGEIIGRLCVDLDQINRQLRVLEARTGVGIAAPLWLVNNDSAHPAARPLESPVRWLRPLPRS